MPKVAVVILIVSFSTATFLPGTQLGIFTGRVLIHEDGLN